MKEIYFVRHAESDSKNSSSRSRPLTEKGLKDRERITEFFKDIPLDKIYSSPYKRAVDTVLPLAQDKGLIIHTNADFCEWHGGNPFPKEEFLVRIQEMWRDFTRQSGGCESLQALERRSLRALYTVLNDREVHSAAIGTHGLILSVLIHAHYPIFSFDRFREILHVTPWIVKMYFDGNTCAGMRFINPLADKKNTKVIGVRTYETGTLSGYRFVVIFAKHKGKWVYCRAKTRAGFETAGGHIEEGETPVMAAKRELFEETGARDFTIRPLFDYAVDKEDEYSNGQVFYADISAFSPLPDYEMAEVCLLDGIPSVMRFEDILPHLYEKVSEALSSKKAFP